jgi:type IV pilus assembly protein PilB
MFVPQRELGDFLIDARLLGRAELDNFLARADESGLYQVVYASGTVPEDELRRAAAKILGVPFAPIKHEELVPEVLGLIPEPLSREAGVIAVRKEGNALYVTLLDLGGLDEIKFLEREQGLRLVPSLTDRGSIKRALLIYQRILKDKFASRFTSSDGELILDALISHALLSHAGEIHLEPHEGKTSVRYRIHSVLKSAMGLGSEARLLVAKLKELANLSFTLQLPQEGKFKVTLKNGEIVRVRVSSLPTSRGEKITLHITKEHSSKKGFTLSSLGIHGETLDKFHEALLNREGLLLISGPLGAGKTTLIYTLLDYLSRPEANIITVEEKVEMDLPYAAQAPVRRELGQTLASSVRAALLHHPDILMVSEIKDEETAALVTSAAARGIFVIAGLAANRAAEGAEKMLELNVDPLMLEGVLAASVGTRVVKKICPDCKEEYHLSRVEAAPIEKHADFGRVLAALKAEGVVEERVQWKELFFARAVGCSKCEGGYTGMIGLQEIQIKNETPLNIIEDGLFKAAQGLTSLEEVRNMLP